MIVEALPSSVSRVYELIACIYVAIRGTYIRGEILLDIPRMDSTDGTKLNDKPHTPRLRLVFIISVSLRQRHSNIIHSEVVPFICIANEVITYNVERACTLNSGGKQHVVQVA